MVETQILKTYGNARCTFLNSSKGMFTYLSLDKNFKVYGQGNYRGDFEPIMTVNELWQELDSLDIEFIVSSDSLKSEILSDEVIAKLTNEFVFDLKVSEKTKQLVSFGFQEALIKIRSITNITF